MLSMRSARWVPRLLWTTLALMASSCNPARPQSVEVTRIVPQTVVVTQVVEKIVTPTLAPEKSSPLVNLGIISGNLCYPSEGIPPLTVYALNVDTQVAYALHVQETDEFQIQVPAEGRYTVFAWTDAGAFTPDSLEGHYSCAGDFLGQMSYLGKGSIHLQCTDADKESHTPLIVTVKPNETTANIYICDWSSQEIVPKP
jgi:hypothetical protein